MPSGYVLTSSPIDHKWGLTANFVTLIDVEPGGSYPPYMTDNDYSFSLKKGRVLHEFQVTYISRGSGLFFCESLGRDKPIRLHEGSAFILFPGEWHNYYPDPKTGWDEYSIGFEGFWIEELIKNGFLSRKHPFYDIKVSATLKHLYTRALEIAGEQYAGYQQLIGGLIVHIISHILYLEKNDNFFDSPMVEKMMQAKEMVENELNSIDGRLIAERLNMSYSNFRSAFRSYTGFPPAKYILEMKIVRAKEMLNCSNIPIKEIALALGFENFEYFSTMFKANSGMTPSAYRAITTSKNTGV